MKFKAELHSRNRYTLPKDCVIEKTITLTGEEFDAFSNDLLKARDFIRENRSSMYLDDEGAHHCLLVMGEGHKDGILVESEGREFAAYAGHVPDAQALLTASRYPSLAEFTGKLVTMADHIAAAAANIKPGETRAVVSMDELEGIAGFDVAYNDAIQSALEEMLYDRTDIPEWEIDKNEFILYPAPAIADPGQAAEPEAGQTIGM